MCEADNGGLVSWSVYMKLLSKSLQSVLGLNNVYIRLCWEAFGVLHVN